MDRNCFWGTSRINTLSHFVQHCLFFIVNSMDIENQTMHMTIHHMLLPMIYDNDMFTWFDNNFMKNETDKYHPLVSSNEK